MTDGDCRLMEDLLDPPKINSSCGDTNEQSTADANEEAEVCTTWRCSESTIFGPTLDETIIYLLGMLLPEWLRMRIGLSDWGSDTTTSPEIEATKSEANAPLDVEEWLRTEYLQLSKEVSQACMNTREATRCPIDCSMLEARRYVLNRLAELMEKKQMVEAEYRSRVTKGRGDCN